MTYGTYPQDKVEDEALITILDSLPTLEENGWYKYENRYYAKISQGNWYKCTRVKWLILSYNGNVYNVYCDMCFYKTKYSERNLALEHVYSNVFSLDNSCIGSIDGMNYLTVGEANGFDVETRKCGISQYTSAVHGGSSYWSGYTEQSGSSVGGVWHYYYHSIKAATGATSNSGGTSTKPDQYSSEYLNRPAAVFTIGD